MQRSSSHKGTKTLRRSCRKALRAHPDTWKDLEAEEHQGSGELAGTQGRTWGPKSYRRVLRRSCR